MIPNPWVLLAGVLLLAATFAGGLKLGSDYREGQHAKTEALVRQAADEFAQRAAEQIANIKPVHQTIQAKIQETVRENTVYRDCVTDPATKRLLDDARRNSQGNTADPRVVP